MNSNSKVNYYDSEIVFIKNYLNSIDQIKKNIISLPVNSNLEKYYRVQAILNVYQLFTLLYNKSFYSDKLLISTYEASKRLKREIEELNNIYFFKTSLEEMIFKNSLDILNKYEHKIGKFVNKTVNSKNPDNKAESSNQMVRVTPPRKCKANSPQNINAIEKDISTNVVMRTRPIIPRKCKTSISYK
jgi:hypothetical protein